MHPEREYKIRLTLITTLDLKFIGACRALLQVSLKIILKKTRALGGWGGLRAFDAPVIRESPSVAQFELNYSAVGYYVYDFQRGAQIAHRKYPFFQS